MINCWHCYDANQVENYETAFHSHLLSPGDLDMLFSISDKRKTCTGASDSLKVVISDIVYYVIGEDDDDHQ